MDDYALTRGELKSWTKDIELLRQLFEFCRDRDWMSKNPARAVKIPRVREANQVVPYTGEEVISIIGACHKIGRSSYERLRAHAMILLMRYAGLRISDVVTLEHGHLHGNHIKKRAVKNGKLINVEVPGSVLDALDRLPMPKAAPNTNKRYFYSDSTGSRTLVKAAWRTLRAVFKASGVMAAHPHRFRHTLASNLIAKGVPIGIVASALGDNQTTIERYYGKWTPEFQSTQDQELRKLHGTNLAQTRGKGAIC
ncbi:MAG: site-specific integrase [Acidobacteriota bacterium]